MLTRKQNELLTYIQTYMATEPVSPSFEEMKDAVKLKSKSGVHRLISALEERGFIRRLPNRARAIELTNPLGRFTTDDLVREIERRNSARSVLSVAA